MKVQKTPEVAAMSVYDSSLQKEGEMWTTAPRIFTAKYNDCQGWNSGT
jgi:hypothetical protein